MPKSKNGHNSVNFCPIQLKIDFSCTVWLALPKRSLGFWADSAWFSRKITKLVFFDFFFFLPVFFRRPPLFCRLEEQKCVFFSKSGSNQPIRVSNTFVLCSIWVKKKRRSIGQILTELCPKNDFSTKKLAPSYVEQTTCSPRAILNLRRS